MTAPTITSASIASNGVTLTINFSDPMADMTSAEFGHGFSLTVGGVSRSVTYSSGDGTISATFTVDSVVYSTEVVTLDYDSAAALYSTDTSELLADVTGFSVTNNSTQNDSNVGAVYKTLDNVTVIATGSSIVQASVVVTLDDASLLANAFHGDGITGVVAKTLGDITIVSGGSTPYVAIATITLVGTTVNGAGTTSFIGIGVVTTEDITVSSSGTQPQFSGNLDKTLDNVTVAATTFSSNNASLSNTLQAVTVDSFGSSTTIGALVGTLDDVTVTSELYEGLLLTGIVAATLDDIVIAAYAQLDTVGTLSVTLDTILMSSSGVLKPRKAYRRLFPSNLAFSSALFPTT